jgi:hypothetical protein
VYQSFRGMRCLQLQGDKIVIRWLKCWFDWSKPNNELHKSVELYEAQVSIPWCVQPYLLTEHIAGLVIWKLYNYNQNFYLCRLFSPLDVVTLCMCAASGNMSLGKGDFGWMAFWGLNPEWLSHNHWRPDGGHFVMACVTGQLWG